MAEKNLKSKGNDRFDKVMDIIFLLIFGSAMIVLVIWSYLVFGTINLIIFIIYIVIADLGIQMVYASIIHIIHLLKKPAFSKQENNGMSLKI